MRPASYRLGVYCHAIRGPGTRSSGFLSLRVVAPPAPVPPAVPVAATPAATPAPVTQPEPHPPATVAAAPEPPAERVAPPAPPAVAPPPRSPPVAGLPAVDDADGQARAWRVWLVPAGLSALVVIGGLGFAAARRPGPAATARAPGVTPPAGTWRGEHEGIGYAVEALAPGVVTVAIDSRGTLARPLVFDARGERPALPDDERGAAILALLTLGANLVDVGSRSERVAAEFPARGKRLPRRTAEQAVALLERLRWLSV
jgi:hypothetical protein